MFSIAFYAGILGLALLLVSFFLDAYDMVSEQSNVEWVLNIAGSALLIWYAYAIRSIPFVVLESAWLLVACIRLLKKKI